MRKFTILLIILMIVNIGYLANYNVKESIGINKTLKTSISANPLNGYKSLGALYNISKANYQTLQEKVSNLSKTKKISNEKIEQCIANLVKGYNNYLLYSDKKLNLFDFVGDKVRLEIILSDKNKIDMLTNYNEKIIIESSYENLVQVLIPVSIIDLLSKEEFVNFIRKPNIAKPCVISEGVGVINADDLHNLGYYGDGAKVAVIDLGFEDYDTNPEIPSGNIIEAISYRTGHDIYYGGKHGSACTEIILDIAPHANLYLYSCGTITEFNNAVNRAISKNVDVISFSAGWIGINDYDGIGEACNIVNNARSHNILFVTASGNEADHHYEGWYVDYYSGDISFHNFGGGDIFLDLGYYPSGYPYFIILTWDEWPKTNQDYDLILWASNHLEIVDYSMIRQTGNQPPAEAIIGYTPYSDYYSIVIAKYDASRNVHLELYGYDYNEFLEYNHPESSLVTPADATGAMTIGATYWQNDNIEVFSSRGPTNDGRIKPDVTAPDYVSTYTYGLEGFPGTSASTPHVAGAAALLLSIGPSFTANDLQNRLETKADDLGSTGKDNTYGSGRINLWTTYNYIIPKANFTYTPSNPSTSNTIQFTDTSTDLDGSITSWLWNFGDGYTSSQKNPSHKYTDNGTYNVTLNVTDDDGAKDTEYKIINVVNSPPIANFTYTPLYPTTANTIQFTDTSTDSDGTIISWLWSFGDGNTSNIRNPQHQYDDDGMYNVTLNVTDNDGAQYEITKSINVSNVPPIVNFTYFPLNPTTSDTIQFNDISIDFDGTIISWSWNFGDGNISSLQNASHKYADDGVYTVTLNVTDDDNASETKAVSISVSNVPPAANFSYLPTNPYTSDTIQFTDTSSDSDGLVISWFWSFGDDSTSTQQNATHKYSNNGNYTVILNVTDDDGAKNDKIKLISVNNTPPVVSFHVEPINPEIHETVFFNSTSYDSDGTILNYTWDFGDGNKSYIQKTTHQYTDYGTYLIKLNVTDDDGETNTTQETIVVSLNLPPYTPSNPYPANGSSKIPLVVNLSWTGGDPNWDVVTYDVYFGIISSPDRVMNNQSSTTYNPGTLDFNTTYYWNIVAWDTHGTNTASPTWSFTTRSNDPPIATPDYFSTNEDTPLTISAPGVLANDNDPDGDMLTAMKVSDTANGTIMFNSNGSFSYVPTTNYYGTDIFTYKVYDGFIYSNVVNVTITVNPVNDPPLFGASSPANGSTINQLSLSWSIPIIDIEGDLFSWEIQCSNGQNNGSSLETNGTKTLSLSGLAYSKTYTIWVNATDPTGSNEYTREWYIIKTKSASSGGGGGGGPALPPNNVPVADANGPYYEIINNPITFDGSGSTDSDGTIVSYDWTFGDGTTEKGVSIIHSYSVIGNYTVKLTVTDDGGQKASDTTYAVIADKPNIPPDKPSISGSVTGKKNIDYNYIVTSVDQDNDSIKYVLDWGDGTDKIVTGFVHNATSYNMMHSWANPGVYTIKVNSVDEHNSTSDTTELIVFIDSLYCTGIGYLIDTDSDGIYDLFHCNATGNETGITKTQNGSYLIDSNEDGKWEYSFDLVNGLSVYQKEEKIDQTPGFELILLLCAIALSLFLKRKRKLFI